MAFTIPKLDYSFDALEPYIDAKTMEIHYTKHHQTYVDNLNKIVSENPDLKEKSLELLCGLAETKNMAGGHFNHSFWWNLIAPSEKSEVLPEIEKLKDEFNGKALKLFGSGWVWIVKDNGELKIIQTALQDAPIISNAKPIIGIDLWEHAYYLKYQNRRAEYIEAFWNVVNWDFVRSNI